MEYKSYQVLSHLLLGIIFSIPELLIMSICIYYKVKTKSKSDGILMIMGSMFIVLSTIIRQILYININELGIENFEWINYGMIGFSFLGYTLFVIGFFILIQKNTKTQNL